MENCINIKTSVKMEKWRAKGDEKSGAGLMIGKNAESFSEIAGVGAQTIR